MACDKLASYLCGFCLRLTEWPWLSAIPNTPALLAPFAPALSGADLDPVCVWGEKGTAWGSAHSSRPASYAALFFAEVDAHMLFVTKYKFAHRLGCPWPCNAHLAFRLLCKNYIYIYCAPRGVETWAGVLQNIQEYSYSYHTYNIY